MTIDIRRMEEGDLAAADRVMRLAFGTFLGMKDPMQFMGDMDFVGTRWRADKAAAFCAVDGGVEEGGAAGGGVVVGGAVGEGVVVGSVFVGNWGSVGFFGPLTVHPDYWDRGVAQLLMGKVMECFAAWGTRHMGLYTFATSLRHIGLYRKFGFAPRFLTVMMQKKVDAGDAAGVGWTKFSDVAVGKREMMIERCGVMTGTVLEGLDVRVDIRSVAEQRLGETILLWAGDELVGLAVCHCGRGTEAGSGICFIKFGVVVGGDSDFRRLLVAVEELAVERGMEKLSGGVNTAREEAWGVLLDSGWRGEMAGVAMQRPNEPGYNRPGVYLIDDWR
jgi:GNAT superfamily N-acetyltransferase